MKYEKEIYVQWKDGLHKENYFTGEYSEFLEKLFNSDGVNVMSDIQPNTRVKVTFKIETLEE